MPFLAAAGGAGAAGAGGAGAAGGGAAAGGGMSGGMMAGMGGAAASQGGGGGGDSGGGGGSGLPVVSGAKNSVASIPGNPLSAMKDMGEVDKPFEKQNADEAKDIALMQPAFVDNYQPRDTDTADLNIDVDQDKLAKMNALKGML